MTHDRHPKPALIVGNWKMHGTRIDLGAVTDVAARADEMRMQVRLALCVPATLVVLASIMARGTVLTIGGQDCHAAQKGAHTGDISARMLKDAGADAVIVGHSERRRDHMETNAMVEAKALAALGEGLLTILCIGESWSDRAEGKADEVVLSQLRESVPPRELLQQRRGTLVLAYEPVWAIGTGRSANAEDIAHMHGLIHDWLQKDGPGGAVEVLYGGSVKRENASEILAIPGVNGVLVGGASLFAEEFLAIARAAPQH